MARTMRWLNLLLLTVLVGGALWAWPRLPARLPLHFGMDGQPDAWGDRSLWAWFGIPALAVVMTVLMHALTVVVRRYPRWVNLPGGGRLDQLPPDRRGPVFDVLDGILGLVLCETLVILGLIQWASWRAAGGETVQGVMLTVLLVAILSSPVFIVIFFTRLQGAMDRARRGLPPEPGTRAGGSARGGARTRGSSF